MRSAGWRRRLPKGNGKMNADRMTERVQDALNSAYSKALSEHNSQTAPEHLLAALLDQDGGIAPEVVREAGMDPRVLEQRTAEAIGRLPRLTGSGADSASVTVSP